MRLRTVRTAGSIPNPRRVVERTWACSVRTSVRDLTGLSLRPLPLALDRGNATIAIAAAAELDFVGLRTPSSSSCCCSTANLIDTAVRRSGGMPGSATSTASTSPRPRRCSPSSLGFAGHGPSRRPRARGARPPARPRTGELRVVSVGSLALGRSTMLRVAFYRGGDTRIWHVLPA